MASERTKRKWHLWAECGWFKGNPPAGLLIKFGEVVEDYPKGWASIMLLGVQVGKFSAAVGVHHE